MRVGLRLVASLLLLGLVLANADTRQLRDALTTASPGAVAASASWMLGSIAMAGGVWWLTFPPGARRPRLRDAVRHTLVGASLNALLPTSGVAADAYRAWACWREGATPVDSAVSIVLARWCSLSALCLGLWMTCALLPMSASDPAYTLCLGAAGLLSAIALTLALALLLPSSARVRSGDGTLSWLTRRPILGVAAVDVSGGARTFATSPANLLGAGMLSVAALAMEGLSLKWAAIAVGATDAATRFVLLAPAVRLAHQVPGFFNAIGLQEVTLLEGGAFLGVSAGTAIAVSVIVHTVRTGIGLAGLPLYLTSGFRSAVSPPDAEAAPPPFHDT